MNVWINIFNHAPDKWITGAILLAEKNLDNKDQRQLVISVYEEDVATTAKRQNMLPFVPCGKVGNDWWYFNSKGEPVVLDKKYVPEKSLRREGGSNSNGNVRPNAGVKKRRPTRR